MSKLQEEAWIRFTAVEEDVQLCPTLVGRAIIDVYPVTEIVNGRRQQKKAYRDYVNMFNRCYGDRTVYPSYEDATVCEEWHTFSVFKKWHDGRFIEDHALDKDLLVVGNREYGPHACCFIPNDINALVKPVPERDIMPGVNRNKATGLFVATVNGDCVGRYVTYEQARASYLQAKAKHIESKLPLTVERANEALRVIIDDCLSEAEEIEAKHSLFGRLL